MSPTPAQSKTAIKPRRRMSGLVLRKSGDKTVSVEVSRVSEHPLYHKRITRRKRYLVHDGTNTAEVGMRVTIAETRPMSRSKRWIIVKSK